MAVYEAAVTWNICIKWKECALANISWKQSPKWSIHSSENKMGKIWFTCRHHIPEIVLDFRSCFCTCSGTSQRSRHQNIKRFQSHWEYVDMETTGLAPYEQNCFKFCKQMIVLLEISNFSQETIRCKRVVNYIAEQGETSYQQWRTEIIPSVVFQRRSAALSCSKQK